MKQDVQEKGKVTISSLRDCTDVQCLAGELKDKAAEKVDEAKDKASELAADAKAAGQGKCWSLHRKGNIFANIPVVSMFRSQT